jgi:hypothetical protein
MAGLIDEVSVSKTENLICDPGKSDLQVGIDVAAHVAEDLGNAFGARFGGGNPEVRKSDLLLHKFNLTFQVLKELVAAGMCGRKTDKGMFVYAKGQKDRPLNQEGLNIIKKYATDAPAATSGDDDIALRLVTRCGHRGLALLLLLPQLLLLLALALLLLLLLLLLALLLLLPILLLLLALLLLLLDRSLSAAQWGGQAREDHQHGFKGNNFRQDGRSVCSF